MSACTPSLSLRQPTRALSDGNVHSLHLAPTTGADRLAPNAEATAIELQTALAAYDIPAYLIPLGPTIAVTLWYGLIARTDGHMIWWHGPKRSSRGGPLLILTYTSATAAIRLAQDYAIIRRFSYAIATIDRYSTMPS